MVKEFLHICRTYSISFRYLKKNEYFFFYFLVLVYLVGFLFFY